MPSLAEELTRYDLTRDRLREALASHLPDEAALAGTVTAYAYWICITVSQRGADWEQALQEYTETALRRSAGEWEAECREVDLIRSELKHAQGPVIDVGAGWGRLAPLYREYGLPAVYVEPAGLGTRLIKHHGLTGAVQGTGEALSFAGDTFATAVIGWVLHHVAAPDVDANAILNEVARVTAPGGRLLSIEPLSESFQRETWTGLLETAGFEVNHVVEFFELDDGRARAECYALAAATRRQN